MADMNANNSSPELFIDLLLFFAVINFLGKIVILEHLFKFLSVAKLKTKKSAVSVQHKQFFVPTNKKLFMFYLFST